MVLSASTAAVLHQKDPLYRRCYIPRINKYKKCFRQADCG
ncbi:unnamed protein product, partial [Rotaria sordida]